MHFSFIRLLVLLFSVSVIHAYQNGLNERADGAVISESDHQDLQARNPAGSATDISKFGKPGRLCPGEKPTGKDKLGFACVLTKDKKGKGSSCKAPKCMTGEFKVLADKAKAQMPKPKKGSRDIRQSRVTRNVLEQRAMCENAQCDDDDDCAFYPGGCNVCLGWCAIIRNG